MRRALLLMVFVVTPLFGADDPTFNLLTAVKVQNRITLEVAKEADGPIVRYGLGPNTDGELEEGVTFAAPRSVDLTYRNYNPFKVSVTSTETSADDPNQKAIGEFLDALLGLAKGITGPVMALDGGVAESLQDKVNRWIEEAHGRPGILKVRNEARSELTGMQSVVLEARTDLASASNVKAFAQAQRLVADKEELARSLAALVKLLDSYLARSWRDGVSKESDLVLRSVTSNPALQKTVSLKFTLQSYTFDAAKNTIASTTDAEVTRSLIIRRYRFFVPEVGVAAVYNELKYPKYSAEKQSDNTFLVRKKNSDTNVDAAITLNMLCNCFRNDLLFPGFQLGVSKAKDYPGIMGGGVLRFAQVKQLSIGFGRMVTWYKDLSTLEVDKPVASEDALTKDLKRKRSPAAWYFAVQYTF